jgi:hypothetical protein
VSEGGLHQKYRIERLGDMAGKHDKCRYFVLDPRHDPLAREVLMIYATKAEAQGNTELAADIYAWIREEDKRESGAPEES